MKKKKTFAIILTAITVVAIVLLTVLILNNKPEVRFKEQLTYEAYSTVYASQLIEEMKNCSLVEDVLIDTTQLGEHQQEITVRSYFLYEKKFNVTITVNDTEAPMIQGGDGLVVPLNASKTLLYKNVTAVDNADGNDVELTIEPEVDFSMPGKHYFSYVATDSSGNKATKDSYVIVEIAGSGATYFTTDNGFLGYQKDGLTYIDGILVVNKTYTVPETYGDGLTDEFMTAYYEMQADASEQGISLYIVSGFRTYEYQQMLFEHFCDVEGVEQALRGSAKPGHSEHETGLAADLNYVDEAFKYTRAYQWLVENCYKYGFILRYTEKDESATGYYYEPWHYRYVGKDLAEILWNEGEWICIENYFGITSVYE